MNAKHINRRKISAALKSSERNSNQNATASTESRKTIPRQEIPWWVDDTTPDHTYKLIVFENGDYGRDETIDLTRAEFIALKKHLAGMRGYKIGDVTTERACVAEIHKSLPEHYRLDQESQQEARYVEIARDLYRHSPDLVVFESETLDQHVANLAA